MCRVAVPVVGEIVNVDGTCDGGWSGKPIFAGPAQARAMSVLSHNDAVEWGEIGGGEAFPDGR